MSSSIADFCLNCRLLARVSDEILEVMPSRLPKDPPAMVGYFLGSDKVEREKTKLFKYVGVLEPNICEKWGIEEHKNKPILVYENRKYHVEDRHLTEFGSREEIERVYDMLDVIIKKPDYVFYNSETAGLEYYKNISYDACVAVEVKPGKTLKVKSWYPANIGKIPNRKRKEQEIFSNNII